jgi:hypothetical protein
MTDIPLLHDYECKWNRVTYAVGTIGTHVEDGQMIIVPLARSSPALMSMLQHRENKVSLVSSRD